MVTKRRIFGISSHVIVLLAIIFFRNQFIIERQTTYIIASIFLTILGLVIMVIAIFTIDKALKSKRPKLVTHGIYSKVKHPIYVGRVVLYVGLALLFKSVLGLAAVILILLPLHIYLIKSEEQELIKRFGKKYLKYKMNTWF